MPQFVLLLHECPGGVPRPTHWDLMLQVGDVLRTWVLNELPAAWSLSAAEAESSEGATGEVIELTAEEIQPHRLAYLDLQGPLSGDRGLVRRIDRGWYARSSVSESRVQVRLVGKRIRGRLELTRHDASERLWRLSFSDETRSPG